MEFVEYVNLIRDAKADVRLKTLFDQYLLLKGEDQECAFFLCLLLQNNPNFLDECVEAAKKKDPKQVLDLAFEAEGANVPVTAFIYLIQILSKGIDGSFGEPFYCSLLDDSLAKKYQDKYGKNFGLGTKTNEIEAGPCFSFGNMVVLNLEGAFPWKNVRLPKDEITAAFVGPNVLDVSASCFSDMPNLKTVFLSSEVMHLNEDSFKNCPNLEKVFIGSNITAIGDNAFNGDSRLEFVGHPFKKVSSLGEGCFASCSNIKELSFGGKVKKIPAHAFENMSSLKEITFGSAITSLGEKAFKNCANLEKINGSIEAPVLIKEIFAGDKSLKDFSFLPPQFKAMRNVFDGTSYELKEDYELSEILLEGDCYKRLKAIHPEHYAGLPLTVRGRVPRLPDILKMFSADEVTFKSDGSIPDNCFTNCYSLKRVTVEGKLKSVGKEAFAGCSSLEQVQAEFEETLEINDYAFYHCDKLDAKPFVEAATSIGDGAFAFNDSIIGIRLRNDISYLGIGAFFGCKRVIFLSTPILVGKDHRFLGALFDAGKYQKMPDAGVFKTFTFKNYSPAWIPTALTSVNYMGETIPEEAFVGLPLKKLNCSFATEIGPKTFAGCPLIERLEFGDALKTIDGEALLPLTKLQRVAFTSNNPLLASDEYGLYAKNENGQIEKLLCYYGNISNVSNTLDAVESIGKYAFVSKQFESIQIPNSMKEVDANAFFECDFQSLKLGSCHYDSMAFDSCTMNSLEMESFDRFPKKIFKFKKENKPLLRSLKVKKWLGEDLLGLFVDLKNNTNCIKELRIGVAVINSEDKMTYLKNLATHTIVNQAITNTKLEGSIEYKNVVIPASAVTEANLLENLNECKVLTIQKANRHIAPCIYFALNPPRIGSLTISDPILSNGLKNMSIDVLRLNDESAIDGFADWGAAKINSMEINFNAPMETVFALQNKADKLVLNGKEIDPNAPFVQDGVLYHYVYKGETRLQIDPSLCKSVAKNAISGVTELDELVVGQGVSLEPNAFPELKRLSKLTIDSDVNMPLSALFPTLDIDTIEDITITGETIGDGFCKKLCGLTTISMDSVKSIGCFAFSGCVSLEKISLPKPLISLGDFAFADCTSLRSLLIPDSVRYIGLAILADCYSIAEIEMPMFVGHRMKNGEGRHPFGSIFGSAEYNNGPNAYQLTPQWVGGTKMLRNYRIPRSLEKVVGLATDGLVREGFFSNLPIPIEVRGKLQYVLPHAFENASYVSGVRLQDLVKVGESAFLFCGLQDLEDGKVDLSTLMVAGESAFAFKSPTIKEVVANDLSQIKMDDFGKVFGQCASTIETLDCKYLPSSGLRSFNGLKKLRGSYKDGVIPNDFMRYSPLIWDIAMGEPVKEVGQFAFAGTSSLQNLSICFASNLVVHKAAFQGMDLSKCQVIFRSIKEIGDYAFAGCRLEDASFLNGVQSIGESAFENCIVNQAVPQLALNKCLYFGKGCFNFKKLSISFLDIDAAMQPSFLDTELFSDGVKINQLKVLNAGDRLTFEGFNCKYLYIETPNPRLPENLVRNARNLERLTIVSPPIEEVEPNAFAYCDSLKEIVADFASSLTVHPTFATNDKLTIIGKKPETILSDVQSPDSFFKAVAANAKSIDFSSSKLVGPFSSLQRLKKLILSGENIEVSPSAFENMKLESVEVTGDLATICNSAFSNNPELRTFDQGSSYRFSVEASAFEGDSKLNIDGRVLQRISSVGEKAFVGCNIPETLFIPLSSLEKVKTVFGDITGKTLVVCVTGNQLKNLKSASITNVVVEGQLKKTRTARRGKYLVHATVKENDGLLPNSFFKGLRKLETIVVESSVKTIGERAFQDCKNLKKVTLPSSLKSIGKNAFAHCSEDLVVELENRKQEEELLKDNPRCFRRSRYSKKHSTIHIQFREGEQK